MSLKDKKVLIFTGGGETQVLNATIYGIVKKAREEKMIILGGVRGWASLLDGGRIVDITNISLDGIENFGGTILKTSRTNPFKVENGINQINKTILENNIDYIIAIGGDDTLGAAKRLFDESKLKIIGVPKTADNDLNKTYFTPGFPSAAHNLIKICNEVRRDSAIPRHRLFIIESQGGHAGWLAMSGAIGKADIITIPEFEISLDKLLNKIKEIYEKNGKYGVICLSQETKFDVELGNEDKQVDDSFGIKRKQHITIDLKKIIEEKLKIPCQIIIPANSLRNGKGSEKDIFYAKKIGEKSIELIKESKFGFIPRIEEQEGKIIVSDIKLDFVVGKENYRNVTSNFYDANNFYPTKEYFEYMNDILDEIEDDESYYMLLKQIHG